MKRGIAYGRVALLLVGLVTGLGIFFLFGTYIDGNIDAFRMLITLFSILAGFLITIMTITGDPRSLYAGSWRTASMHRREIHRALVRYKWLFYVYLTIIGLTFLATLFERPVSDDTMCIVETLGKWFGRSALGLGMAALIWSFGLATALIHVQVDRLDEEVERRKQTSKTDST